MHTRMNNDTRYCANILCIFAILSLATFVASKDRIFFPSNISTTLFTDKRILKMKGLLRRHSPRSKYLLVPNCWKTCRWKATKWLV